MRNKNNISRGTGDNDDSCLLTEYEIDIDKHVVRSSARKKTIMTTINELKQKHDCDYDSDNDTDVKAEIIINTYRYKKRWFQ